MDDFILEIPESLSSDKCKEIIERFEKDDRRYKGITGNLNPNIPVKKSLDLNISCHSDWKDIDKYLYDKLSEGLNKYDTHLKTRIGNYSFIFHKTNDTGYQIQRTGAGEYYSWHEDSHIEKGRIITFIWYLNTLDPVVDGGGTIFHGGKMIKPEEGKLLLFPATWTYLHAGLPYVGTDYKYICTGWIHADMSPK
jgi:Rps23 Pro-64 3,4-dihydroxylase Tpa1-like proline 4-hydroxylase